MTIKIKRHDNGTATITGLDHDTLATLLEVAGDLGAGNAVLRFDSRVYERWCRPNKKARKGLRKLEAADPDPYEYDWADRWQPLDGPKFACRKACR